MKSVSPRRLLRYARGFQQRARQGDREKLVSPGPFGESGAGTPVWRTQLRSTTLRRVLTACNWNAARFSFIWPPLRLARRSRLCARWLQFTAWLPVPLLALTMLLIAGAQIRTVSGSWRLLGAAAAVFIAFAVIVPFLARFVARRFGLAPGDSAFFLLHSSFRLLTCASPEGKIAASNLGSYF